MSEPNPKGWEQLIDLVGKNATPSALLDLAGGKTSLVWLRAGKAYAISVEPAPDGEYPLQTAGQIVVHGSKFQHVLGTPNAAAAANPEG